MTHKSIFFAILLAAGVAVLCASTAAPKKKAFKYDGLILRSVQEHVLEWDGIAADKHLSYVYFEVPFPAGDTALLRKNIQGAQAHGLKTGMCFTFTDSLRHVSDVLDHLLGVPGDLCEMSPMISIPTERKFERRVIHRWIQIWANVLNRNLGEQPILKADREDCKDYLAPVLTSTYRICLVFADPSGSYMLQHPEPLQVSDSLLIAFPCRVETE